MAKKHRQKEPKNPFSKTEMEIIQAMDFVHLHLIISPVTLYRMMGEKAFTSNRQDGYAQALREALQAIDKGKPSRDTPEWDELLRTAINHPQLQLRPKYHESDPKAGTPIEYRDTVYAENPAEKSDFIGVMLRPQGTYGLVLEGGFSGELWIASMGEPLFSTEAACMDYHSKHLYGNPI